jgi:hypothetical protein
VNSRWTDCIARSRSPAGQPSLTSAHSVEGPTVFESDRTSSAGVIIPFSRVLKCSHASFGSSISIALINYFTTRKVHIVNGCAILSYPRLK